VHTGAVDWWPRAVRKPGPAACYPHFSAGSSGQLLGAWRLLHTPAWQVRVWVWLLCTACVLAHTHAHANLDPTGAPCPSLHTPASNVLNVLQTHTIMHGYRREGGGAGKPPDRRPTADGSNEALPDQRTGSTSHTAVVALQDPERSPGSKTMQPKQAIRPTTMAGSGDGSAPAARKTAGAAGTVGKARVSKANASKAAAEKTGQPR
jgi:hypothetical protein